ncbi:TetR/AcrR family transcriptional regulator [Novosphingopyxis sp.]|uniref:TetR/AcrR family transcriptional regulator n=1 Tax=Novosphingopyxis sp. TaxID=2709690 RepID=UPI003B5ABB85
MSDIANIAEVQPAALYYHFPSKEALIEEVVTLGQRRVLDNVARLAGASTGLSVLDRIRLAIRAHLEITLRDCDFASASIRTLGQLPADIRERQLVEQRRYGDFWRQLIAEGIGNGEIKRDVPASALRMLALGALNWMPEWWDPGQGSIEDIITAAQAVIVDGLRA